MKLKVWDEDLWGRGCYQLHQWDRMRSVVFPSTTTSVMAKRIKESHAKGKTQKNKPFLEESHGRCLPQSTTAPTSSKVPKGSALWSTPNTAGAGNSPSPARHTTRPHVLKGRGKDCTDMNLNVYGQKSPILYLLIGQWPWRGWGAALMKDSGPSDREQRICGSVLSLKLNLANFQEKLLNLCFFLYCFWGCKNRVSCCLIPPLSLFGQKRPVLVFYSWGPHG